MVVFYNIGGLSKYFKIYSFRSLKRFGKFLFCVFKMLFF